MVDPTPIRRTLTLAEIAEQLGVPVQRLYRNRAKLRASGFPPPLPGVGNRYDPRAIEIWMNRAAGAIAVFPTAGAAGDPELAAAQARMDSRAAGLA